MSKGKFLAYHNNIFEHEESHFAGYVIPQVGSDIFLFIEFDQLARGDGLRIYEAKSISKGWGDRSPSIVEYACDLKT